MIGISAGEQGFKPVQPSTNNSEKLKLRKGRLSPNAPFCPYCFAEVTHWPADKNIGPCDCCRRPIWLYPKPDKRGQRQLLSIIDAGRVYISLFTLFIFLGIFLIGYFDGAISVIVMMVLAPFGLFDLIEAQAGFRSKSQRVTSSFYFEPLAFWISMFKAFWGIGTLILAAAILSATWT